MIKTLKRLLLLLSLPLLTVSCHDDKDNSPMQEEEPVSLTISLKVPRIELTRGVSDDPRNEAGNWTMAEKLTDGRELYHVTLFLVEETTGKLVGLRDIEYGSEHITDASSEYGANGFSSNGEVKTDYETGTEVTFNFLYDHPRHGDCEKLRRGKFRLLAVANYTAKTEHGYDGLADGTTKLETLVNEIKEDFDIVNGAGVDNFFTTYETFFDFQIHAGDDNLCDKNYPQPLTLVQDIYLNPGDNHIAAELKRTYARVRIEVMNNSSTNKLKVHNFAFSNNFAQTSTYLFTDPDNPLRQFTNTTKAAPVVTSAWAMTSYVDEIEVNTCTSHVLFDGYILESQAATNENYTYNLDVEYEGETFTTEKTEVSSTVYSTTADLVANYDGQYFLIQNRRKSTYIYCNTSDLVYQSTSYPSDLSANQTYLWKLEAYDTNNNQFYIYNVGRTSYIGKAPGSQAAFPATITKEIYFTFSDYNEGIQMAASEKTCTDDYYYMNDYQGNFICSYAGNDGGNDFKFIPVNVSGLSSAARYADEVVLETIDPLTARVSPVEAINRNDFIDVLITTNYQKNNDKGHFLFEVVPWKTGGGDIEFN